MSKIKLLDTFTSNRIAAGEVVERPASIVKELIENSLDAQSTSITVEIRGGGIEYIRVTDNGFGIESDDTVIAFERHATSKIGSPHDLDAIATLGFRGEALSSIASVAQVELTTRALQNETGTFVRIHGGEVLSQLPSGCPEGTTMVVQNVFFNTPARLKFLKKPHVEAGYIGEYLSRMIMARPDVSFKYINNGNTVYHSAGDGSLIAAIYCVYGSEIIDQLLKIEQSSDTEEIEIKGFIGGSDAAKQSRSYQSFFVNGRYIRSSRLSSALQEAFGTRLMGGKFPFCVLHLSVPFDSVDVNIHPNKLDVRFRNEAGVIETLLKAVQGALGDRHILGISNYVKATVQEHNSSPKNEASINKEVQESVFRSTVSGTNKTHKPVQTDGWALEGEKQSEGVSHTASTTIEARTVKETPEAKATPITSPTKIVDFKPIDDSHIRVISIASATSQVFDEALTLNEKDRSVSAAPDFSPVGEPFSIVGQAFASYAIVQQGDSLYFIDQHAAHERILFEQFTTIAAPVAAQQLLMEQQVQLAQRDYALLKQNEALIRSFGFAFEYAAEPSILIHAVPYILGAAEGVNFLLDAVEALETISSTNITRLKREKLALLACKRAVKANTPLTASQIEALIERFAKMGELNCPHGRPILIRMTKRDLEKLFKRIV